MTLSYTWKVTGLKKQDIPQINVTSAVIQTYWQCTGTDENGLSGTFSGATPFAASDINSDGFINYADLTEEIILGWIQSQVIGGYKDHVDARIMEHIEAQKNPVIDISENDLPWS